MTLTKHFFAGLSREEKLERIHLLMPHSEAILKRVASKEEIFKRLEGASESFLLDLLYVLLEEQESYRLLKEHEAEALEAAKDRYEHEMEALRHEVHSFKSTHVYRS